MSKYAGGHYAIKHVIKPVRHEWPKIGRSPVNQNGSRARNQPALGVLVESLKPLDNTKRPLGFQYQLIFVPKNRRRLVSRKSQQAFPKTVCRSHGLKTLRLCPIWLPSEKGQSILQNQIGANLLHSLPHAGFNPKWNRNRSAVAHTVWWAQTVAAAFTPCPRR